MADSSKQEKNISATPCASLSEDCHDRLAQQSCQARRETWLSDESPSPPALHQRSIIGVTLRYSLAIGIVTLFVLLREALERVVSPGLPPYLMFYPSVMLTALLAGFGPGLVATLCSAMVVAYWLLPPAGFGISAPVDRLALTIYCALGLALSGICALYQRSRDKSAAYDAAMAIHKSHARLATFAQATFEGLVESEAGRILDCNEQLAGMLGYSVAELRGTDISRYIDPQDLERVRAHILHGQESLLEHGLLRRDGTRITVETHGRPVFPGSTRRFTAIRDISERVRAAEAIKQSEALYRGIGESIDYGIWVCAADGRNIYASESFLRMVGITQEQCSDFGWGDVLHPDDAERTIAAWQECARTGKNWDIVHRFRGVDGQWHHVLARGVPIRNEHGEITCWAGINLNIDRLKQTESALRESETRFRDIVTASADWFWEIDANGAYCYASENVVRVLGYTPDEIIGRTPFDLIHPASRAEVQRTFQDIVEHAQPFRDLLNINCHKDGSIRHILTSGVPIFDDHGQLCGYRGTDRDVTDQKHAELQQQQQEERLRLALEAGQLGTWDWHIPSDVIVWNDIHFRILGYEPGEIRPSYQAWAVRVHPDDIASTEAVIQNAMAAHQQYSHQYRIILPDGTLRWMESRGEFSYDQDNQPLRCYGIIQDVSERKQAEEVLRQTQTELEQRVSERTAELAQTVTILVAEIKERRAVEAALKQSAREIEDLYNFAPCGYHSLDRDGVFVRINDTELVWLGYSHDEVIGKLKVTDIMTPESRELFAATFPRFKQGKELSDARFSFIRKDGSIMPVLLNAVPIMDEQGEYVMSRTTIYDITDLVSAEESLRRLNLLYLTLSETGKIIARLPDRDKLFAEICRIAVEQVGFLLAWIGVADDASGLVQPVAACGCTDYLDNIRITTRDEPEGDGPTGQAIRNGTYYICNDFMENPSTLPWHDRARTHGIQSTAAIALKEEGWVIGALTLYSGEKNFFSEDHIELLIQIGADVSFALDNLLREQRRHQAEQALREETLQRLHAVETLRRQEHLLILQSRQAAMGEMIGNIAHQWRQPLNSLGLYIQRLGYFYNTPSFDRQLMETSVAKSMEIIQYMSRTIDDFRNFFSTEREKSEFRIDEAVEKAYSLVEASFKERRIQLEVCSDRPVTIFGHPNEYAQVLLNILVNAKDAINERNVESPEVRICIAAENSRSVVTISDNAGGISAEIIDKVFDPYFTTKGPQQGTGIGLFMSRMIIENNMGGTLSVHNTHQGAEFRIEV